MIVQRDDAADPFDIGAHHVHADATARHRRHLGGRRQPRLEDQVQLVLLGHPRRRVGRQPPGGDRLFHQPRGVDAGAIVADLDHDLVARLARLQPQAAGVRLARRTTPLGRLDAMVDAVAHDMGERVDDHLHHLAVHLDIAAFQAQLDPLVEIAAQVAHHARHRREQALDPLHAGLGNHVAHVGDTGGQPLERAVQFGVGRPVAQLARQFVARQHHVRHAVHQLVDQRQRQADGAQRLALAHRRDRGRGLFGLRFLGWGGRRLHLRQRADQIFVILVGQGRATRHRLGQFADPVHDRQHRADGRGIGLAVAGANLRQHILGRMAQFLEARQIEEAAAPLDRVEEAENGVQPLAIARIGLPGDDFARQSLQRFLRFGYEFLK